MSVLLMSRVWELDLAHQQQAVLLAMADHAHDDGTQCYPGVAYLAWKTGYSRRTVQRVLRGLESNGLLEPIAGVKGGRGRSTRYRIHVEKGVRKAPYRPDSDENSDSMSPFADEKGDNVTPFPDQKGDIRDTKRASSTTKRASSTTKRVTSATQKGDTGVTPTIKNHQEPPERTTEVAADAAVAETPYQLYVAFCEEVGAGEDELAPSFKRQQCAIAKQLLEDGFGEARVRRCIRYLRSQDWRTGPIDLRTVRSEIGAWEANGSPAKARSSRNNSPDEPFDPDRHLTGEYAAVFGRRHGQGTDDG